MQHLNKHLLTRIIWLLIGVTSILRVDFVVNYDVV